MESDHAAAQALRTSRLLTLSGLLIVLTVAWSTPAGQIAEDTKNDLYVDPWGLMARALHLWDPQVTWGMLQNQGYGYLFPMGPFYAVLSEIFPVWIVERLWWSALLTGGYLATLALLRALGYGRSGAVHVGALAYALAPRVLSTLGAISPEAQTQLLAPLILLPLVSATQGRLGTRRAAALSGAAILLCGGVNATATVLAAVPAGCWLITRRRWWRSRLTWSWLLAALAATAWWLGPLVLLGRYSPPFLGWIENAAAVVKPIGLLDVLKGTSHWLGHLLVPGGPWWPAGWALSDSRSVVIASSVLAGLSLAGLAMPIRERRFVLVTLLLGLALLVLPQSGTLAGPLAGALREALDGPLAPLRNIHKADPLVRLPLAIGLVNAVRQVPVLLGRRRLGRRLSPRGAPLAAAALVVIAAGPALAGNVATRGTFTEMPLQWRAAGVWLDEHADQGGAIILPAASFGEYTWGRTIDEPLRSLTTTPYAVRDAIPLTPAGTIRLLDEIQRQAQSGRELRGVGPALLAAGVKFILLRNDLDTDLTGGDPVVVTRSALLDTPGIERVAGFGKARQDLTGERISPVEIFAIDGSAARRATLWPALSVPGVSGASEALPSLQQNAIAMGPVIFDGDAPPGSQAPRIETDSFRARTRYFGAPRSHDITRTLTAQEAADSTDYFPWPDPALRSVIRYGGGLREVSASTAVSDQLTVSGLLPARRPFAALDSDPATAWLAFGDPRPTLGVTIDQPRAIQRVRITPASDSALFGGAIATATRVRVEAAGRAHEVAIAARGTWVDLSTTTDHLTITILDTDEGAPGEHLTGLAEVEIPGIAPTEIVETPAPATTGATSAFVLTRDPDAYDGCPRTQAGYQCLTGGYRPAEESGSLNRQVRTTAAGTFELSGSLIADPAHPSPLLHRPGVRDLRASSSRTLGLPGAPDSLLDADPATAWGPAAGDRAPRLSLTFEQTQTISGLRFAARSDWLAKHAPLTVAVTRDGHREITSLRRSGAIALTARTARDLTIEFLPDAGSTALRSAEFSGLDLHGASLPPPTDSLGAACGEGPALTIGTTSVKTAVLAQRPALLGTGSALWQACESVPLPAGEHTIRLGTWEALVPTSIVARTTPAPVSGSITAAASAVDTIEHPGGRLTGEVAAASYERLLTLTQNVNPGWRATIGGVVLAHQTVDGYRQAFRVPPGASGALVVEFGPDAGYRRGLALGGLAALALVGCAAWPARPRRGMRNPPSPSRYAVRHLPPPLTTALWAAVLPVTGLLVAGPAGAVVGAAVAVATRLPHRWRLVHSRAAVAVTVLLTLAGIVHAVFADGTGPGSAPVAATTRLLVLAAVISVLAAGATQGSTAPPSTAVGESGEPPSASPEAPPRSD